MIIQILNKVIYKPAKSPLLIRCYKIPTLFFHHSLQYRIEKLIFANEKYYISESTTIFLQIFHNSHYITL